MPSQSDASLVARVAAGDATAFEVLVRRYFRAAYLVALARVGEHSDAEDVCQEAFLRAWQRIHECRNPDLFAAWLVRIVRNTALNRREYLRVRAAEPLDATTHPPASRSADFLAEQQGLRAALTAALAQLTFAQREVVLLHDLEGWPHAAIATHLGVSELMSRRHLSDARRRLRVLLGDFSALMLEHHD